MLDLPTYFEEEIAELFGVLALVLLLVMEGVRHPTTRVALETVSGGGCRRRASSRAPSLR